MLGHSKKTEMPGPAEALPGRSSPIETAITHFVSGNPLPTTATKKPNVLMIDISLKSIEAGVDFFFGHGPHVIRGIEMYQGKPMLYNSQRRT